MNNKKIRSILQDALEEEIPSSQVNLWPAVKASLVAGKYQGEKMNSTKSYHVPRFAYAALVIAVLLTVALVTPQGLAFAQSILQFFMRAPDTTFPVPPPLLVVQGDPDPSVPTAEPPAPLISVAEAEARVGFNVAELPFVPDGFNYLGARLYGNIVSVEYRAQDYGGHLIIKQSQQGFDQSEWDQVPADAIVPVKIGELDGEFVRGRFVVYVGETVATWEPDASILRLRWVKDGIWFEMTKSGHAQAIEYLDQTGLIELAESLVIKP